MPTSFSPIRSIGMLGFGAFGRLIAEHLHPFFDLVVHDRADAARAGSLPARVVAGSVSDVARCDLVVLAVPVSEVAAAVRDLGPHLRPGGIVLDVGSVKVKPVAAMLAGLPPFVDIVGTHPLFGPQSARHGIRGRRLAICAVRGRSAYRVAAFLRARLGLEVLFTSPEDHDRELAVVQGVTHLIAKVLVGMEPLPRRLTTASFDHLMAATEMVRYDSEAVFLAIERDNPFAEEMQERFFSIAAEVRRGLGRTG